MKPTPSIPAKIQKLLNVWVRVVNSTSRGEVFGRLRHLHIKAKNLFSTYERSLLTEVVYHA